MNFHHLKSYRKSLRLLASSAFLLVLLSCNGGQETAREPASDTGSIRFSLVFEGATRHQQSRAATLDCAGLGVATIEAMVYDPDNALLVSGGPWECDAGQGTIDGVKAGGDRTVVLLGSDADGNVVFRGENTIDVVAGSANDAGTIHCAHFYPNQFTPESGVLVEPDGAVIEWNAVSGASQYRLLVSEHEDLSDPIIDVTITETSYTPSGLSEGKTYFWQIFAIDLYGNTGYGPARLSFATKAWGSISLQYRLVSGESVLDCATAAVSVIDASVYDPDSALLQVGGPWDCNAGQGTITDVEAGSDRVLILIGKDVGGNVIYRGQKAIDVAAGGTSEVGTIDCTLFIPNPQAPANEAVVEAGGTLIEWDAVPGASEYRLVISENQDLSDPIIDEVTDTTSFTPTNLSNGKTYFWRIFATDVYENTGIGTTTRSFDTKAWIFIAAGYRSTFAIKPGGTLWSWGDNYSGQLGLGDRLHRPTPTQVGTDTDWAFVHASYALTISYGSYYVRRDHTVALKKNGTLWAWGDNDSGKLGLGDTDDRSSPAQVGTDSDWILVHAGNNHTVALKTDGTIWAWGEDVNGCLGLGDMDDRYSPTQVGTDTDWTSVHAGDDYTVAVKADGSLWAWGSNWQGQLGLGDTNSRRTPTQVGTDTDWASVYASDDHTIAIKEAGSLWAWGDNHSGRLGLGDRDDRSTPTQVGTDTDWVTVYADGRNTVAVKTDGTLWAWGDNYYGQLGLGDRSDRYTPIQVGTDTDWTSVHAGGTHMVAIKEDGSLWTCGWSSHGQLGNGTTGHKTRPLLIGTDTDWAFVRTGGWFNTVAMKTDDTLWVWGSSERGQLGLGDMDDRHSPTQVGTDTDWAAVHAGYFYTLALKTDGTLWAWGDNYSGNLGLGHTYDRDAPTQVGTDTDWESIYGRMAVKADGTLWAWGYNGNGQLGLGDTDDRHSPTRVGTDNDWAYVHFGGSSIAIKENGSLWAWGLNDYGQLGLGDTDDRYSPTQVGTDTDWAHVHIGNHCTLAMKENGSLWAWGRNYYGQLGLGDTDHRTTPIQVGTDTDWASVRSSTSYYYPYTVAVKTDGTLWAWGNNRRGQLGLGDTDHRHTPTQVGTDTDWASAWVSDSLNYPYTMAVKTNGTLWAWGGNYYGQLGLGDRESRYSPTQVGSDTGWASVDAGEWHVAAVRTDGSIWAWGDNSEGQLGGGKDAWEDRLIQISLGSDRQVCPTPIADATGDWWVMETSTDNDCNEGTGEPYELNVQQTGSTVNALHPNTGRTFSGWMCGDAMELTGSYPEDGGLTTVNALVVTVTADSFTGTSDWTWTDGSESCSGTTILIGSKQ